MDLSGAWAPDLYLMRHGQTLWNAEGRLQGRLDSPLTELGIVQARRQKWLLGALSKLDCYASPAGRAQQTARIVFAGRPWKTDPRLAEIDIGCFAGELFADLARRHPTLFSGGPLDWYDKVPGGEHFDGLESRLCGFLADLRRPAAIVTHGVTLRMLRALAMGLPRPRLAEMAVHQGAVHLVSRGRQRVFY